MKRVIAITMICLLSAAPALHAGATRFRLSANERLNAAVRSLVLPGWGQYSNGRKAKGYVLGGLVLATTGLSLVYFDKARASYRDYEEKGMANDRLYSEYENNYAAGVTLSVIAVSLWLYGALDASMGAAKRKNARGADKTLLVSCDSGGFAVSLRKRF